MPPGADALAAALGAGAAVGTGAPPNFGASAPPERSLNAPAATSMVDLDAPEDDDGAAPAAGAESGKPQPRQNLAPAPALAPQLPHLDMPRRTGGELTSQSFGQRLPAVSRPQHMLVTTALF